VVRPQPMCWLAFWCDLHCVLIHSLGLCMFLHSFSRFPEAYSVVADWIEKEDGNMPLMLMDLGQAAEKIGCSPRWLADGLRAGRFPGHKVARKWRLTDDDVTAILEICSVTPASAFSADSSVIVASSSSMTKTTARRLQQSHLR
jgi:hypothetical protein